jgi:NitT/TauT family transport system ATP-binding protein
MTLLRTLPLRTTDAAQPGPAGAGAALREVSKRFGAAAGGTLALDSISFSVRPGEFLCIAGPSGCGKSTLLNLLAGLDRPTSGALELPGGRPALMFQDAALFPWLTVEQNIAFPLRMQGAGKAARRRRVEDLLRLVRLEGAGGKRPHQLSGGMRQRVALARALAQDAPLLLMDEPFASLLHGELERIWRETGLTVLFVTHDVREAVRLGDRVLLLSQRPARIATEFAIDLPRPRDLEALEVAVLAGEITRRLREEAERHAAA